MRRIPAVRSRIVAFDNGPMEMVETLARHVGPRGEVVVRRRSVDAETVEELIVNGVFAMDSAETGSERLLAELALARLCEGGRILVGGLGLGYTVAPLLGHGVLDVVEIEECLIDWAYAGLTPTLHAVAADPDVRLHHADVRLALADQVQDLRGPWNAILLDVDNGPDFLIHESNDALYAEPCLRAAYAQLVEGGLCAIWCQGPAPRLLERLRSISPDVTSHVHRKVRDGREHCDVVYTMIKAPRR